MDATPARCELRLGCEVALLILTAAATVGPVTVEGGATCPSPEAVAEQLLARTPSESDVRAERVQIESDPQRVHITLYGHDGNTIVERTLPAGGSCADLARAAGVLIEVWLAERHPEWTLPSLATPAQPGPAVVTATKPPPGASRHTITAAAGPVVANGQWLPGLSLAGMRWYERWGATLGFEARGPQKSPLGTGEASWMRATLWGGAARRVTWNHWGLVADGGVGAGLTLVSGQGFTQDLTQTRVSPVATVGTSLGYTLGQTASVFLAARATLWPWWQTATADSAGSPELRLPSWDLLLALGLGF